MLTHGHKHDVYESTLLLLSNMTPCLLTTAYEILDCVPGEQGFILHHCLTELAVRGSGQQVNSSPPNPPDKVSSGTKGTAQLKSTLKTHFQAKHITKL